jgi:hypothetical protein
MVDQSAVSGGRRRKAATNGSAKKATRACENGPPDV